MGNKNGMSAFNGDYINSSNGISNIGDVLNLGKQTEPSPKDHMSTMSGYFWATDGRRHNLDEIFNLLKSLINSGGSGGTGFNGWTPIPAIIEDGERRVLQIIDWTGGQDTKPDTGVYVTTTGLTSDISSAVDIRGGVGASGKSAYEVAVRNGFEGSETEWLDSLKGECAEILKLATREEAENGVDDNAYMSPLKTKQAIDSAFDKLRLDGGIF